MSDQIIVDVKDRVQSIRMNRPEKKNALNGAMYTAMTEALLAADSDNNVRAIVIGGTEDCFTAGNDIADFAAAKPGQVSPAVRFLETLAATAKPVLAAVSGVAIGIGTTMLLHCDLVYATEASRFQLPFVNLGLCPEAASSMILPALMGTHRAAELLLFGEPFGADVACKLGIVNQVVTVAQLLPTVDSKAKQLAQKPPASLRATKMLLKSGHADAIKQAMAREGQNFAALLQGPEAKEAMTAFLARRKPDFSRF
ncbi:MAG TPA: enoyl-CoA hydratase [Candidatus Angelobacter sp.]|nr:enoyl-CoA hydratase [Candidatus Angelobacter sp.]